MRAEPSRASVELLLLLPASSSGTPVPLAVSAPALLVSPRCLVHKKPSLQWFKWVNAWTTLNMKSLKAKFRKTDVNEWNKNDERLLAAVEHGEVEKVASLLAKKGASAVKLDTEGKSALHVAAARGLTDCLSAILTQGADLSVTDAAGLNSLHLAAKNSHNDCCRKLIQSKCPIDTADSSGKTALHHAAASGNVQTVQLLCELKSPVNLKDSDGFSPLLLAARNAHADVCTTLLDCGAEINASDNSGRTALMLATEANAVSVVDVLLQQKASLSVTDSQGQDVMYYAKLAGHSEVKAALMAALNKQQTADVKSPRSPLHDQVAKQSDERNTTPKKRKAPPPPISPLQSPGPSSPSLLTSTSTPLTDKGDTPKRFNYKEVEVEGTTLRDQVEKLHEERNMLLDTIEDLKQTVTGPELDTRAEHSFSASAALVSSLQAKITALTLENQQLANKLKKHLSVHGYDDLKDSRPNSMASNASFYSTREDFEVEELKAPLQRKREGGGAGGETTENEEVQKQTSSTYEQDVRSEEDRQRLKETEERADQLEKLYEEAQVEIRMLQEALRGTVPVEAAAKDFEEMKAELNEIIAGLHRRLLELSHSYSDARSKLSAAQKQLDEVQSESTASSSPSMEEQQQQVQVLSNRVEELQALLADRDQQTTAAQEEVLKLKQEAEAQAQSSVALTDHMQVMSSLGNAVKELESQSEALKEQLQQKTLQVDALQNRLAATEDVTSDDSVSHQEHETMREQLEGEVSHLTQLLQGALRKQDEMALEAADAWQKARDNHAECEALQELLMSREKENQTLTSRLAESQDAVCQLKQLVENHVASEREKNKRIDDLSREVVKLKDALNSLSQLSYTAASPTKRQQQQNQQMEALQQQIKQLQYQLTESKKQHQEIVSVYRMHLLYAVQGQMDEDVQKALKQILIMCKMPSQTKEAC
ncbi:ankycorbin [Cynoglossus semilaevis]|uniref:ankycorbin n=1 Tax=Cynoglossus semilaevis TaxID=244447 RepID=UPI000D623FE7|nr:ankycorbin [Cynoglossus semilaevis]